MKWTRPFYLMLSLCSVTPTIYAQDHSPQNTFGFEIGLGITASQMKGDSLSGYFLLGYRPSLASTYNLSQRTQLLIQLSYEQLGSSEDLSWPWTTDKQKRYINLEYISIGGIINYSDWMHNGYQKIQFLGGLQYGRLIREETSILVLHEQEENYSTHDLRIQLGIRLFLSKHHGLQFMFHQSVIPLLSVSHTPELSSSIRSHYLSLGYVYRPL